MPWRIAVKIKGPYWERDKWVGRDVDGLHITSKVGEALVFEVRGQAEETHLAFVKSGEQREAEMIAAGTPPHPDVAIVSSVVEVP